jgi:flagellar protein FliO/FliZ
VTVFALALDQAVTFGADPAMPGGRALLSVVIVIGLLGLAAWLLRRNAPSRASRQTVTVETAVALGDKRSLVIVAVEGRRLLLGLTPGAVALVTELAPSQAFSDALRSSIDSADTRQ